MPLTNSIEAYDRVRKILDEIVAQNETARLTLPTAKSAVRFRAEAYYFRKLLGAPTPYDSLRFIINADEPNVVLVEVAPEVSVTFTGRSLGLKPFDDPLLQAAQSLMQGAPIREVDHHVAAILERERSKEAATQQRLVRTRQEK